jgi:hypothetical protein
MLDLVHVLGVGVGCLATVFGAVGVVRKSLPVTRNVVIVGKNAQIAGWVLVFVGIAVVVTVEVLVLKVAYQS